jgi:uncharacterized protein Veg
MQKSETVADSIVAVKETGRKKNEKRAATLHSTMYACFIRNVETNKHS